MVLLGNPQWRHCTVRACALGGTRPRRGAGSTLARCLWHRASVEPALRQPLVRGLVFTPGWVWLCWPHCRRRCWNGQGGHWAGLFTKTGTYRSEAGRERAFPTDRLTTETSWSVCSFTITRLLTLTRFTKRKASSPPPVKDIQETSKTPNRIMSRTRSLSICFLATVVAMFYCHCSAGKHS